MRQPSPDDDATRMEPRSDESVKPPRAPARLAQGDVVGRYVVLDEVGSGGMGVVYRSYDPKLQREVALKVLRADLADDDAGVRLRREAQAMAQLSHPNVLPVYDVEVAGGRQFIAMELVEGRTVTRWLADEKPSLAEVLRVFRDAGRGLAAAHVRGIVHRDFKPSNVMVGDDERVRVMDFGLARATGAEEPDSGPSPSNDSGALHSTLTQAGVVVGTPAYMAPEQHGGAAPDANSDQFAFCAALFHAVAGRRPFRGDTYEDLLAAKLEGSLPEPASGRTVPGFVRRAIARGLARDAERRWPSMHALVDELDRDPAASRRRLGLVALGAASVVGLVMASRAQSDRDLACEDAAARVAAVWTDARRDEIAQAFLLTGVPYASDSWTRVEGRIVHELDAWSAVRRGACEATHVHGTQSGELLDRRMVCLDRHLREVGALLNVLADPDPEVVERSVSAASQLPPLELCSRVEHLLADLDPPSPELEAPVETLRGELIRSAALNRAGRYAAGLAIAEDVLQQAEELGYVPLVVEARLRAGVLLEQIGRPADAANQLREAFFEAGQIGHRDVAWEASAELVSVVGRGLARYDDAYGWARHAEVAFARTEGTRPYRLLNHIGNVLNEQGRAHAAVEYHRRALAAALEVHGAQEPEVAASLNNLGNSLDTIGEYDDALEHYRRATAIWEHAYGPSHPEVASGLSGVANVLTHMGRTDEAIDLYRRALAIDEQALGPTHPRVSVPVHNVANILHRQGRHEEALTHFRRALAIQERAHGPDHPNVAIVLNSIGSSLRQLNRRPEAAVRYRRALGIIEVALGSDHADLANVLGNLATVLRQEGRVEEALASYRRALTLSEASLGSRTPGIGHALNGVGECLITLGRARQAAHYLERAVAVREPDPGRRLELAESRFALARALWQGRVDRQHAVALARLARDGFIEFGEGGETWAADIDEWLASR